MREMFAFLLLLSFSPALFAQATFGTVTGSVTDPTGATVPNTEVVVTNEGTNVSRTATTREAGTYDVPNLNPGRYRVTAKAAGFKTAIVQNIDVTALRVVRVDREARRGRGRN